MNELVNERTLESIALEINYYKQQTVQNIIEIGKRLVEAKNKVPHGEWGNWLDVNVKMNNTQASRFMRVSNEIPNLPTSANMTISQAFEILTLPEDSRQEFVETHDVESMTTRELRKAIKKQKELEKENTLLEEKLKLEKLKPVKEIVKEVEVFPSDYEKLKKSRESIVQKDLKIKKLESDVINRDKKISDLIQKNKEIVDKLPKNERDSRLVDDAWSFVWAIEKLLKDVGGLVYLTQSINDLPKHEREYYVKAIENIHGWANQIKYNLDQEKEGHK